MDRKTPGVRAVHCANNRISGSMPWHWLFYLRRHTAQRLYRALHTGHCNPAANVAAGIFGGHTLQITSDITQADGLVPDFTTLNS
jgi:hypothetical protein